MRALYTLSIYAYRLAISIASLWSEKARLWLKGRKQVIHLPKGAVWVHCASLGEFEQGRPVIEALRHTYPNLPILLTFFSPSGYTIRHNYTQATAVAYLPLDTPHAMRTFVNEVGPIAVIFVKYEIWHNLLHLLRERMVPAMLISAKFRTDHIYFRPWGRWFAKSLLKFSAVFVQDSESATLLQKVGVSAQVAGDTRFDRVVQIANENREVVGIETWKEGRFTVVAGSTWPEDEALLAQWYRDSILSKPVKLIIAPHEVHPLRIAKTLSAFPNAELYSNWSPANTCDVLVIDQIGILSRLYNYGDVCMIGGGFGAGIHNTLEAAVYGKPLIFGPEYEKFAEATSLVAAGAAQPVSDFKSFQVSITNWMDDAQKREKAGKAAFDFTRSRTGATNKIMIALRDQVPALESFRMPADRIEQP